MKSKTILLFILIGFSFSGCFNCLEGVGNVIEEKRTLSEFNEIEVNNSFDVEIILQEKGSQNHILINAQENLIPFIITEVNSNELSIESKECFNTSNELSAKVFLSEIEDIDLNSSGSITCNSNITSENFQVELNGSGEIELIFNGEALDVNNNGSGDIKITGTCESIEVDSNGSGNTDLSKLVCDEVIVDNNGSGDVYVHSLKSAELDLNGSGDIFIGGNPQNIKNERNGSGKINKINE